MTRRDDFPDDMRYIRFLTMPRTVRAGRVLVHNHVQPRRPLDQWLGGVDGFRAWTQRRTRRIVRCHCGWAPHIPAHYRVQRDTP